MFDARSFLGPGEVATGIASGAGWTAGLLLAAVAVSLAAPPALSLMARGVATVLMAPERVRKWTLELYAEAKDEYLSQLAH